MSKRITGKKAALINQGSALDAEIKELQEELKEVREALQGYELEAGSYITSKGNGVKITSSKTFADLDPIACHQHMRNKRQGKEFPSVVKIAVAKFKKFCTEEEFLTLRPATGERQRWTWI